MKSVGYKQIPLKAIRVDAVDIRRRTALKHVKELADDIESHGGEPIHAVSVRVNAGNVLLCGRDRFAALTLKKKKKAWAHLYECDDVEAEQLELAENIYRRPSDAEGRAKALARLVALHEQQHQAEQDAAIARGEKVSASPANTPIARARKEVARAAGVSTAAVVQAEKRAAKSAKKAENGLPVPGTLSRVDDAPRAAQPEAELPEGFQAYGVAVAPVERDAIVDTVAWLKGLELAARQVVAAMTDADKHHQFAIAPAHIQGIRERAQQLGHALREAIPAGLCPYCKDQAKLMYACAGCGGVGVVGRNAGDHVPRELLATDPVMVAVNGQIVPLAEAGAPVKPKAKKNAKAIHVEVIDEVGAAPRELTLDRDVATESEELF